MSDLTEKGVNINQLYNAQTSTTNYSY